MSNVAPTLYARVEAVSQARFGADRATIDIVQAPGRIELIGNHLDYNGGPVLAAAIDRGIAVGRSSRHQHGGIRAIFADMDDATIHALDPPWQDNWRSGAPVPMPRDYLRGVVTALTRRGLKVREAIEIVVAADLPHGIGISSSAALCVALAMAVAQEQPPPDELVLVAQEAEHRVGSPCGTMDQSASVYGGLIEYDGASGRVAQIMTDLADYRLVVVNSGVVRSLATSAYPDRVRETAHALRLLREAWQPGLQSLAAVAYEDLDKIINLLASRNEAILAKRVRHIVTETQRVRHAVGAVSRTDWPLVGRLMYESGQSSALDYEVSHPAVEQIVSISMDHAGVIGARMMGGGQGGSVLVLVAEQAVPDLIARLDREYFGMLGSGAPLIRTLTCSFAEGAGPAGSRQA